MSNLEEFYEAVETFDLLEKSYGGYDDNTPAGKALKTRYAQGWRGNPTHDAQGRWGKPGRPKSSVSTGVCTNAQWRNGAGNCGPEKQKFKDMGNKKVAKTCGRHARDGGRDIRCYDDKNKREK